MEPTQAEEGRDLILWDGDCGLCRRSVRRVLAHDHAGRFRAMPYQSAPTPPMTPQLREACARAVHVLTADGAVLRGGRATVYILERLGYRGARLLAYPPFLWLTEAGYFAVSRNRRFFSKLMFRPGGSG